MASGSSFITDFIGKVNKLGRLNRDFKNNLTSRQSMRTYVIPSLQRINTDIKTLYTKITALKQQIDNKRSRVTNNTGQINDNQSQVATLNSKLTQLNIDKKSYEERYATLEAEIKQKEGELEQRKREITKLTYLNNNLNIQLSKLPQNGTNSTAPSTSTIQQQTQQNASILQNLENEIAQKGQTINQLHAQLSGTSQNISSTSQNVSATSSHLDDLNRQIRILTDENNELIDAINQSTEIINEAARNLQELNNQGVNDVNLNQANQIIEEISKSIQDLSNTIDDNNPSSGQSTSANIQLSPQRAVNLSSIFGSPSPNSNSNPVSGWLSSRNIQSSQQPTNSRQSQQVQQPAQQSENYTIKTNGIDRLYNRADLLNILNGLKGLSASQNSIITNLRTYLLNGTQQLAKDVIVSNNISIDNDNFNINGVSVGNINPTVLANSMVNVPTITIMTDGQNKPYTRSDLLKILSILPQVEILTNLNHFVVTNQTVTANSFIRNSKIEINNNELFINGQKIGNIIKGGALSRSNQNNIININTDGKIKGYSKAKLLSIVNSLIPLTNNGKKDFLINLTTLLKDNSNNLQQIQNIIVSQKINIKTESNVIMFRIGEENIAAISQSLMVGGKKNKNKKNKTQKKYKNKRNRKNKSKNKSKI